MSASTSRMVFGTLIAALTIGAPAWAVSPSESSQPESKVRLTRQQMGRLSRIKAVHEAAIGTAERRPGVLALDLPVAARRDKAPFVESHSVNATMAQGCSGKVFVETSSYVASFVSFPAAPEAGPSPSVSPRLEATLCFQCRGSLEFDFTSGRATLTRTQYPEQGPAKVTAGTVSKAQLAEIHRMAKELAQDLPTFEFYGYK